VYAVAQQPPEAVVDLGDSVDCRGNSLADRHPSTLGGPARLAGAPTEAGGCAYLGKQLVPLVLQPRDAGGVAPPSEFVSSASISASRVRYAVSAWRSITSPVEACSTPEPA
jgi:hypothetical protein